MITLHPYDASTRYDCEPWTGIPQQLQMYLGAQVEYANLSLLAQCDPYDGQRFPVDKCCAMLSELKKMHLAVRARAVSPPPEWCSQSPGEPADIPFGWDGLEQFCGKFTAVLEMGIATEVGIISLGD